MKTITKFDEKSIRRRQQQDFMQKRRRAQWFADNGPCVDCGSWDNLELDHVVAKDKVDHNVWSWAPERAIGELAKCAARCKACHIIKSIGDRGHIQRCAPLAEHGLGSYSRGCRCDICKKAQRECSRRYYLKKLAASGKMPVNASKNFDSASKLELT